MYIINLLAKLHSVSELYNLLPPQHQTWTEIPEVAIAEERSHSVHEPHVQSLKPLCLGKDAETQCDAAVTCDNSLRWTEMMEMYACDPQAPIKPLPDTIATYTVKRMLKFRGEMQSVHLP